MKNLIENDFPYEILKTLPIDFFSNKIHLLIWGEEIIFFTQPQYM